jgi:hypothetical protein
MIVLLQFATKAFIIRIVRERKQQRRREKMEIFEQKIKEFEKLKEQCTTTKNLYYIEGIIDGLQFVINEIGRDKNDSSRKIH